MFVVRWGSSVDTLKFESESSGTLDCYWCNVFWKHFQQNTDTRATTKPVFRGSRKPYKYPTKYRQRTRKKKHTAVRRALSVLSCQTLQLIICSNLVKKLSWRRKVVTVVTVRPVNAATIKESWPMPHLDSEVLEFRGSQVFAVLDFVSAYWQLLLHPGSYDACGIVGPKEVLVSKRVLPGLANATSYFQSTIEPLFQELRANMKAWLDDFNLHATNEEQLLLILERFFEICENYGLFLSAKKCIFFATSLKWCGRIINSDGYTMDPSRIEGLQDMQMPQTADELSQFMHCCRWMSLSIPEFFRRIAPLSNVIEEAHTVSGKRNTQSIKGMQLRSLSWGTEQESAFLDIQDTLRNAVKLSYPDPQKKICVFTDASEFLLVHRCNAVQQRTA